MDRVTAKLEKDVDRSNESADVVAFLAEKYTSIASGFEEFQYEREQLLDEVAKRKDAYTRLEADNAALRAEIAQLRNTRASATGTGEETGASKPHGRTDDLIEALPNLIKDLEHWENDAVICERLHSLWGNIIKGTRSEEKSKKDNRAEDRSLGSEPQSGGDLLAFYRPVAMRFATEIVNFSAHFKEAEGNAELLDQHLKRFRIWADQQVSHFLEYSPS